MINSIPVNNSFSWRRFVAVARFYYPRLRIQILVYPIAAVFFSIWISVAAGHELAELIAAPVIMAIGAMISFGPIALACRKGIETETLLPATGAEKCTFILLYGLIIIPLLILRPMQIMYFMLPVDQSVAYFANLIFKTNNLVITDTYGLSVVQHLAPAITCLWAVMTLKNNRVVMGIVWTFVFEVITAIIGASYGIIWVFKKGYNDGFSGVPADPDAIAEGIIEGMIPFMIVLSVIMIIYCIFALVKTCQNIKNRQL